MSASIQPGPGSSDGIGYGADGLVLTDDPNPEPLLHTDELLPLAFQHLVDRNAGPARHDVGDSPWPSIGLDHALAQGNLILSLGKDNTEEEIDYVIETFGGIVEKLRSDAAAGGPTAVIVAIFGGLTLWLQDETFLKMKPTIVQAIFSLVLLGGLAVSTVCTVFVIPAILMFVIPMEKRRERKPENN